MFETTSPCPFCGNAKTYLAEVQFLDTEGYAARCTKCSTQGPADLGKSGAVEAWDTRPTPPPAQARVTFTKSVEMETIQRTIYYTCSLPGDQSGDYIPANATPQQQADGRIAEAMELIDPYRSGGVSGTELTEAYALLKELVGEKC